MSAPISGGPDVIAQTGPLQRLVFGEYDGSHSPRAETFYQACKRGGINAELSDDVRRSIWEKYVVLVAMSGATTAMRSTIGPIRTNPLAREFLLDLDALVTQRNDAIARMKGLSKMSGRLVSWEDELWGVESTARCLQALAAAEPFSTLIPMAIRHMMLSRRGYIWSSTRDTAIALLAIADYLKATNAQFTDATVSIIVNGRSHFRKLLLRELRWRMLRADSRSP